MSRGYTARFDGEKDGHTTQWIEGDDIAMELHDMDTERQHKFRGIPAARPRRQTQPGLELSPFAENQHTTSPQVVDPPSLVPLATFSSHELGRQASSRHLPNRESNQSPLHSAQEDGYPASRTQSRGSEAPIALKPAISHEEDTLESKISHASHPPTPHTKPQILGLPIVRFWLLISFLIITISIALAVGLAVGLNTSNRSSLSANPNVYSTPTSQGIQGQPSPAAVNPYCPGQNGSIITPYDASGSIIRLNNETPQSFTLLCNTYYPYKSTINPAVRDILVVFTPDLYACLQLCASYNAGFSDAVGDDVFFATGGICVSAALEKVAGGFCHLQNATGVNDTTQGLGGGDGDGVGMGMFDTAVLVGDWDVMDARNLTLAFGGNWPEEDMRELDTV